MIEEFDKDYILLDNTDTSVGFSPEAKSIKNLTFPYKTDEDKKPKKSAHTVNKAFKKNNDHKNLYFFKNNPYDANNHTPFMSELEALSTAFYKLLAPENVPAAHAYYDFINPEVGYAFIGVASKAIPNFTTNYASPLLQEDTVITPITESINEAIHLHEDSLMRALSDLLPCLERSPSNKSGYLSSSIQYTKNVFNFFRANTAVSLKNDLKSIISRAKPLTSSSIDKLLVKLEERQKSIANFIQDPGYKKENSILSTAIEILEDTIACSFEYVPLLEELDRQFKLKNIKLEQLDNKSILKENIGDQEIYISVGDMKNYRIVKRQAVSLVARYLMQDDDGHNRNMSKDGWIIDFDRAKLPIVFQFRKHSEADRLFRSPNKNTFVITASDIANFPDIHDAHFFYWVTKDMIPDSLSGVSWFYPENCFRKTDTQVYKNLPRNPVFIFHKYKSLLKYILCDEGIFRHLGELYLRPNLRYVDENDHIEKNLLDEIIKNEVERIKQVHDILVKMPMFQKYLATHGKYVFKLIKEEFDRSRDKQIQKLKKSQRTDEINILTQLISALDSKKIESRFNQIAQEVTTFQKASLRVKKQ